jgi:hypothetical protein
VSEPVVQPFYVRSRQNWAVGHERQRHVQALFAYGEPCIFTMLWKVEDYNAGLVALCPRCRVSGDTVWSKVESAYKQPVITNCTYCYGTTFEGGIRAQVLRPAIFSDTDEDERPSSYGVVHAEHATIETTEDFRVRNGDFVFRKDGSRWQLTNQQRLQVRTGYEQPTQRATSIGYARIEANREALTSVAYIIPPTADQLRALLTPSGNTPDYDIFPDVTPGPLIPTSEVE